jgi:flagellar hook-length control protein FliK
MRFLPGAGAGPQVAGSHGRVVASGSAAVPSTPSITTDVGAAVPLASQRSQTAAAGQQTDSQPFAALLDASERAPTPATTIPAAALPKAGQKPATSRNLAANDSATAMVQPAASTSKTVGGKSNTSPGTKATSGSASVTASPATAVPATAVPATPDTTSDAQANTANDDEAANASSSAAAQPDAGVTAVTAVAAVTAGASTAPSAPTMNAAYLAAGEDAAPAPTTKSASATGKDASSPAAGSVQQAQPSAAQPAAAVALISTGSGAPAAPDGSPAIDPRILTADNTGLPPVGDRNAPARNINDAAAAKSTPATPPTASGDKASAQDNAETRSAATTANAPSPNTANARSPNTANAPSPTSTTAQPRSQPQPQPQAQTDNSTVVPALTPTLTPATAENSANRPSPLADAMTAATAAAAPSSASAATGAANANTLPNFGFLAANALTTSAAAPAASADAAVPLAGLAVAIAARSQAGTNRFDIRLDPPELGRIDVRLAVDSSGQVTSHVTVDRADTLQLLQSQQPQLEHALEQAGLRTADNGLQFTLRDQSFAGQNGNGGGQQNAAQLVIPDTESAPVDTAQIYSRLSLGSGLDIRV